MPRRTGASGLNSTAPSTVEFTLGIYSPLQVFKFF
jgi:hypothetical protein